MGLINFCAVRKKFSSSEMKKLLFLFVEAEKNFHFALESSMPSTYPTRFPHLYRLLWTSVMCEECVAIKVGFCYQYSVVSTIVSTADRNTSATLPSV